MWKVLYDQRGLFDFECEILVRISLLELIYVGKIASNNNIIGLKERHH